jgi:hypothetical protein
MKNPYKDTEEKLMQHLVAAINLFSKLDITHPSSEKDFVDGIHKCQNVIFHRIVQRDYPGEFPTYRKKVQTMEKENENN